MKGPSLRTVKMAKLMAAILLSSASRAKHRARLSEDNLAHALERESCSTKKPSSTLSGGIGDARYALLGEAYHGHLGLLRGGGRVSAKRSSRDMASPSWPSKEICPTSTT
jgi:hypothetical protein